ncbi:hypothetical protein, partial [Brevibacillus sp. HB2.2]|uniref:hypothetical protein n=1 Tax=Brevibacillus sp. HB2.2 TaxID=2738846 RepID=UPI001C2C6E6C
HIMKELLWTQFRFLHGVGQSIPQWVDLEAERFLLFPPHHHSPNSKLLGLISFFYYTKMFNKYNNGGRK